MHLDNYEAPPLVPFWGTEQEAVLEYKLQNARCRQHRDSRFSVLNFSGMALFGSHSIGRSGPNSDHDVLLDREPAENYVLRFDLNNTQVDQTPVKSACVDVLSLARDTTYETRPIIAHLSAYAQWAPVGHKYRKADPPEFKWTPPTRMILPFMPADVEEGSPEWYVRTYRELVRGCLETRGHAAPPNVIVDEMWNDPLTRMQVREQTNDTWGDAYEAAFTTRLHRCGTCRELAVSKIPEGEVRDPAGQAISTAVAAVGEDRFKSILVDDVNVAGKEHWDVADLLDDVGVGHVTSYRHYRKTPNALTYFCSDACEKQWQAGRVAREDQSWISLPWRWCAYTRDNSK